MTGGEVASGVRVACEEDGVDVRAEMGVLGNAREALKRGLAKVGADGGEEGRGKGGLRGLLALAAGDAEGEHVLFGEKGGHVGDQLGRESEKRCGGVGR